MYEINDEFRFNESIRILMGHPISHAVAHYEDFDDCEHMRTTQFYQT